MRKKLVLIISFCLLALTFTACTNQNSSEAINAALAAKNESKTLKVLCFFQDSYCKTQTKLFEKNSGIKTTYTAIRNIDDVEKMLPDYDILYGGSAGFIYNFHKDLFEPYISKYSRPIDSGYKDPNGYWTGVNFAPIIFCSNKQKFSDLSVLFPTSWQDLLDSDFKSHIAYPNPLTDAVGANVIYSYWVVNGQSQENTRKYFEQLDNNVYQYATYAGDVADLVVNSDSPIATAITVSHDCLRLIDLGYPLKLTWPTEGTSYLLDSVAISKSTKTLSEAQAFVDYVLSNEGQSVSQQIGTYQLPVNPNVPLDNAEQQLISLKINGNTNKTTNYYNNDQIDDFFKSLNIDYYKHSEK